MTSPDMRAQRVPITQVGGNTDIWHFEHIKLPLVPGVEKGQVQILA